MVDRQHYVMVARAMKAQADAAATPEERRHWLRLWDAAVQDLIWLDSGARGELLAALPAILLAGAAVALLAWQG
jgi:truncated hemoglobin YjbI